MCLSCSVKVVCSPETAQMKAARWAEVKIRARVSNQCSAGELRRAEEQPWSLTWPPSEMSNTGCTFFLFFIGFPFLVSKPWSFRCATFTGGCRLQSVEVWGNRGWFQWSLPQVERNCNKSVMSFGALRQWRSFEALQSCF